MSKALQNSSADAFTCVAQLLSGRQAAAAAVVAASSGNVRLASLIAQVCLQLPWLGLHTAVSLSACMCDSMLLVQ